MQPPCSHGCRLEEEISSHDIAIQCDKIYRLITSMVPSPTPNDHKSWFGLDLMMTMLEHDEMRVKTLTLAEGSAQLIDRGCCITTRINDD